MSAPSSAVRPAARWAAGAPLVGFALALLAVSVLVATGAPVGWTHDHLPGVSLATLLVAFAVAEALPVHFEMRREAISFSLSTIPLLVGLFGMQGASLLVARLVGTALVLVVLRRQRPLKLLVNLACVAIETATALALFRSWVGLSAMRQGSVASWPAALMATAVASIVFALCLAAAISIYQRRWERSLLTSMVGILAVAVIETCLGLVAVTLLVAEPVALAPLAVVTALVLASFRTHRSFRQKHADLEALYDFAGVMGAALRSGEVTKTLLGHAAELMHAEAAWLVLVDGEDGLIEVSRTPEGDVQVAPAGPAASGLHGRAQSSDGPYVAGRHGGGGGDMLACTLRGSGEPIGTLIVSDRSGEVRRFGSADLRRMAALAGHATVAIEHSDLVRQLRLQAAASEHQSLHDALTGLPNRLLFSRQLEAVLGAGQAAAVLLVDLDRFKEVNDALGHHNGDLLLGQVGLRLEGALRETDLIARLGGDEFAVLLPGVRSQASAVHVARAMIELLEQPFMLGDMPIGIGASIGVALAPEHGTDAGVLVQRADVAMYTAKADQTGVEVYCAERDSYSATRLSLVSELRQAIHDRQLEVYLQPMVDLEDGGLLGLEALCRWHHPERGPVSPDEFIALAERTGLIFPLTELMLDESLRHCRQWLDSGWQLRLSVNLSARSLLQPDLAAMVASLLARHRVPAANLCLEVTESSIMSDLRRTTAALEALRAQGITIAIDDFGTGHSSLARLKNLPVGEIKIDRSFVMSMLTDANDEAIVRTVVDLARNLRIPVVAEGVESPAMAERLRRMGCGSAQGYLFGRPLPAERLAAWLGAHPGLANGPVISPPAELERELRVVS